MRYDTMQSDFIITLFLFLCLTISTLVMSIKVGAQSSGNLIYKMKAGVLLLLSFVWTICFIRVTAPTDRILWFLNILLISAVFLLLVMIALSVIIYLKTKPIFKQSTLYYGNILDEINDYVLIFDSNGEIAVTNHPKEKELFFTKHINTIDDMVPFLGTKPLSQGLMQPLEYEAEIEHRHFYISTSIITNKEKERIGIIFIFHDITKEHQLIQELQSKNDQISNANVQLLIEMEVDEELLVQQEQERLFTAIHIELEEKMNQIVDKIVRMRLEKEDDILKREKNLREITAKLRMILADLRQIVYNTKRQ